MRRGLVVGKFSPLHRGHQLLIETALASVDALTVVVYDSKVGEPFDSMMPAKKRAGWISTLYPNIENLVIMPDPELPDWPGGSGNKDDPQYADVYAQQLEFLGPFTHVFSSEDYGLNFAHMLSVLAPANHPVTQHVMVDAARELVPMSGTQFRSDMYRYRAFVDPIVYRSLIQKVVFVGTESTGKSTISAELAKRFNTMHTQEYGRTLWVERMKANTTPSFRDLYDVALTQYEQEQAAMLHSRDYLFCDTNAWTTMMWSAMYHKTADARLYDLVQRTKDEYIWFYCHNDFDWVQDGWRELDNGKAAAFANQLWSRLARDHIYFTELSGPLEERIETVEEVLRLDVSSSVW
jgi:HTH-type transcriptional repressor of NAD biosynthesis genes